MPGIVPLATVAGITLTLILYLLDLTVIFSSLAFCNLQVTAGERSTMTMWFTLDPEHQEDRKVCGGGDMLTQLGVA